MVKMVRGRLRSCSASSSPVTMGIEGKILNDLLQKYQHLKVNFDLEDEDNILRVECLSSV